MRLQSTAGMLGSILILAGGTTFATAHEEVLLLPQGTPIQNAIDMANHGDTILVPPGQYLENIDFHGKNITLRSEAGPAQTIIRAFGPGSVVTFASGETLDAVLEGFTITGGTGTDLGGAFHGGGIFVYDAGPTIRGNWIVENVLPPALAGRSRGGGIYARRTFAPLGCFAPCLILKGNTIARNVATEGMGGGGYFHGLETPLLTENIVQDNHARAGGGFWLNHCGGEVTHSQLLGNVAAGGVPDVLAGFSGGVAGGLGLDWGASTYLGWNRIEANSAESAGGGIFIDHAPAVLQNSLVAYNQVTDPDGIGAGLRVTGPFELIGSTIVRNQCAGNNSTGGGMWCKVTPGPARMRSVIVWDNHAAWAEGVEVVQGAIDVGYCDIQAPLPLGAHLLTPLRADGFTPAPAVTVDPGFVDPDGGDFSLRSDSPCMDVGDPTFVSAGRDLAGNPRLLDGRLDRQMIVDMGAFEFGNVHLQVSGELTPGGLVSLDLTGKPGLIVIVFAGTRPAEVLARPYGPMFFDPLEPSLFTVLAVIPDHREVVLPATMSVPQPLVVQALGFGLFSYNGNFSNSVELLVQ